MAPPEAQPGMAIPADDSVAEEGPSRFDVLLRNRRRLLLVLLLILIAAATAYGSLAVFTSSSVNPTNTFSSGTLSQSNSLENAAILTATKMVPGDSRSGTVTIKNTGDVSGRFSLSASDLTDTPGPNGSSLSQVLRLQVVDTTDASAVYEGPYDSMPKQDLGSWTAGEDHTYEFTVTFPDTGKPGSSTTGDNAYEGSSTSVTYVWDAVSE